MPAPAAEGGDDPRIGHGVGQTIDRRKIDEQMRETELNDPLHCIGRKIRRDAVLVVNPRKL